jgi:hypothetical protein
LILSETKIWKTVKVIFGFILRVIVLLIIEGGVEESREDPHRCSSAFFQVYHNTLQDLTTCRVDSQKDDLWQATDLFRQWLARKGAANTIHNVV